MASNLRARVTAAQIYRILGGTGYIPNEELHDILPSDLEDLPENFDDEPSLPATPVSKTTDAESFSSLSTIDEPTTPRFESELQVDDSCSLQVDHEYGSSSVMIQIEDEQEQAEGDEWCLVVSKAKSEATRKKLVAESILAEQEKAKAERFQAKAEERAERQQYRAEMKYEERRLKAEQKDKDKWVKAEERVASINQTLDVMVSHFGAVLDQNIPSSKLPIIIVYDTEHAPGYVENERRDQSTELGLAVVALARVRELIELGHSYQTAFVKAMHVVHLRFVENGKWQLFRELDRNADRLWQAAFTEFGQSHWVYIQDLSKHIVAAVEVATGHRASDMQKQSVVLVAHASSNDEEEMQKLGFCWADVFEVLGEADTQILAWGVAGTVHQPGLKTIMERLLIQTHCRHHGGNDAAYTAFVLGAVTLGCAKEDNAFQVTGEPMADVRTLVDQHRTLCYTESSTYYIHEKTVCHICGALEHTKVQCNRRCLYCGTRRNGDEYHNYLNYPVRAEREQVAIHTGRPTPTGLKVLTLGHSSKTFYMTEAEYHLLEAQKPKTAASKGKGSRMLTSLTENPRRVIANGLKFNKPSSFTKSELEWPALGEIGYGKMKK